MRRSLDVRDEEARQQQVVRDLVNDRTMVFIHRTSLIWCALSLVIPYLIGGWSALLWAGLVRVFLTHHVTWSVNSVCHVFGGRPFNTNDRSTKTIG